MESAGRPSLDSVGGRGTGGNAAPAQLPQQPGQEPQIRPLSWQTSPVAEERAAEPRARATDQLGSVAERKSEYGLEGLIASYGPDEEDATGPALPDLAPETKAQGIAPSEPEQRRSPEPEPDGAAGVRQEDELHRFSTSPKLPDLARMSMFEEDLFSSSVQVVHVGRTTASPNSRSAKPEEAAPQPSPALACGPECGQPLCCRRNQPHLFRPRPGERTYPNASRRPSAFCAGFRYRFDARVQCAVQAPAVASDSGMGQPFTGEAGSL